MSNVANDNVVEKQTEAPVPRAERTRSGCFYRPNVDILEQADELTVYADMPGTSAQDVDISFDKGVLTLHGRVKARQTEGVGYLWREYGVGDFYRTFQVGEEIDSTRISAEYKNGVLILHLPKVERAKARKISVKTS